METLQELTESYWLRAQLLATTLYVLFTLRCLKTKRQNWLSLAGGMWLLLLIALVAPFAALAHSGFWSFILVSGALGAALFWYEGHLVKALMQNNPGAIAYLIPFTALFISLPLATLIHFILT